MLFTHWRTKKVEYRVANKGNNDIWAFLRILHLVIKNYSRGVAVPSRLMPQFMEKHVCETIT